MTCSLIWEWPILKHPTWEVLKEKSVQILSLPIWFHRRKGREGGKVNNLDCHCHGPSEIASDPIPLSLICIPWNPNLCLRHSRLARPQSYASLDSVIFLPSRITNPARNWKACILKGQLLPSLSVIWWQLPFDCVSSYSCCALPLEVSLLCNLLQRTSFGVP